MKKVTFLIFFFAGISSSYGQTAQLNSSHLQEFVGYWRGNIEYFDSKKTKKNLKLPTELICKLKNNTLIMNFKYYDKNGEFTRKTEKLSILENGKFIKDNAIWAVLEMSIDDSNGYLKLFLESSNEDGIAEMQKIISIDQGKLYIEKKELISDNDESFSVYLFNFDKLDHKLYR